MILEFVPFKHPKATGLGIGSNVNLCLQSFVTDNVYNDLNMVQLTYQQVFVDQRGVKTMHNVVRQMATPPIPYPPFSVNFELELLLNLGTSWLLLGI